MSNIICWKTPFMNITNINKIKIFSLFLLTAGTLVMAVPGFGAKQDEVIVKLDPQTVLVGEPTELRLVSILGFVEIQDLPIVPGLKWASQQPLQSKRTTVVNTKRATTFNSVYSFSVNKEGTITIPAMKVRIGHIVKKLKPIVFKAYKQKLVDANGNASDLDEVLYVSAMLLNERDYIYLGEEVPMEIRMYSVKGLPVSCVWPVISVENIVLRDFGKAVNPDSSHFIPPVRRTVKLENQLFNVDIFKTAFRAISPGELKGKITIPCIIKIPRNNQKRQRTGDPFEDFFRDDFFSSYRKIQYKLVTDLPERKIRSLPTVPSDSIFLGLVGNWNISMHLSSEKLKSGDPVTLKIIVSGTGTLDTLTAPELKLPGFRIYPPEIKKGQVSVDGRGQAEIRYAMIPQEEGPANIDLNFSTFSPKQTKYLEKKFNRKFNVQKGENTSASVVDNSILTDDSNIPNIPKNKVRHGILYLKRHDSGGVELPLYKNRFLSIIFFLLLGPLVLIGFEFLYFRRGQLKSNPLLRRKANAKKRKRKVIEAIANSSAGDMHNVIQNDVTPFLNDLLGHPPGTSAAELADKIEDPELAECLNSGSTSSFMPGVSHEDPKALQHKLLKAIQKITLIACCFLSLSLLAADGKIKEDKVDLNDPLACYDTGHFQAAEKYYQEKLNRKRPDPAILYNLGNCFFQQGNFPKALVCYERAKRLDPSDSDIIENLNYIRRKLLLPEIGTAQNPLESLRNIRDGLRADTWLLFASIAWTLCWISILLRRYLSVRKWIAGLTIYLILLTICIFAYVSQVNTTYSPKNAIVIKKGVPVYSLPTTSSQKSEFKLRPGSEVTIKEERHNWKRIRDEQSEGWVKSDAVEKLWPY